MLNRLAAKKILEMATKFPIVALLGPRQSGKTTLAKMAFPSYSYVSLENPDMQLFASSDPKGFLKSYNKYVILDEIQKVPELFSYLQQQVDDDQIDGQYILSGSQNFLLSEKISQSLAGRVYILELLPFSQEELKAQLSNNYLEAILKGSYPRVYHKDIAAKDFYPSYIKTYIERDVRSIVNVQDLASFQKFIKVLAHHVGQIFNANTISNTLGIDAKTVQRWLSILQTSYLVFTLPTWHKNFQKRIIKSPKLYFYDTGLVASLLGFEKEEDLSISKYKGALFENYGILEILKQYKNHGQQASFYYWRDSNGNEIDLVIDKGEEVQLIEMKASETVKADFLKSLHYLDQLDHQEKLAHFLYNSSSETQYRSHETIVAWNDVKVIFK